VQLGDLGEHCKLPQRGLGRSPSGQQIWCILAWKSDIWWHHFFIFPDLYKKYFPLTFPLTFPDHSNSLTYSSFPWPVGTLYFVFLTSALQRTGTSVVLQRCTCIAVLWFCFSIIISVFEDNNVYRVSNALLLIIIIIATSIDGLYCFHRSFFSVRKITREPQCLAWWNFARTSSSTTARTPLSFTVKDQGHFFVSGPKFTKLRNLVHCW